MYPQQLAEKVFSITSDSQFNETAIEIFHWQAMVNPIFKSFLENLKVNPSKVTSWEQIPFLPIEFFRHHKVYCGTRIPDKWFESSGTTGTTPAIHYFDDYALYERSFNLTFRRFYGDPAQYRILALMPSPQQRPHSSLVYMVNSLIGQTHHPDSGFYLERTNQLAHILRTSAHQLPRIMVIGIAYALLDFVERFSFGDLSNVIVVETGGMKGRRQEMVREELHRRLLDGFKVMSIHSEYGMTELFSQAWSSHSGYFHAPPWMRVLIRDAHDPFEIVKDGHHGAINVIDLANLYSCAFIATEDVGRKLTDGSFEVLGRLDYAALRGCNLMV